MLLKPIDPDGDRCSCGGGAYCGVVCWDGYWAEEGACGPFAPVGGGYAWDCNCLCAAGEELCWGFCSGAALVVFTIDERSMMRAGRYYSRYGPGSFIITSSKMRRPQCAAGPSPHPVQAFSPIIALVQWCCDACNAMRWWLRQALFETGAVDRRRVQPLKKHAMLLRSGMSGCMA